MLDTWNLYNIVNQLYLNIKKEQKNQMLKLWSLF